jgi:hypothetical protein
MYAESFFFFTYSFLMTTFADLGVAQKFLDALDAK